MDTDKKVSKEFQIGHSLLNLQTRTQFTLQSAASKTIHRAQGLSMDTLAFEPTGIRTHGLVYTALLRVRDQASLYILNNLHNSNKSRRQCFRRTKKAAN